MISSLPATCGTVARRAAIESDECPSAKAAAAAQKADARVKPATEQDWSTEYLDAILSVKVVDGLKAAIDHVAQQNLAEEFPSAMVRWFFYSHPPIRERVDAARAWRAEGTTPDGHADVA